VTTEQLQAVVSIFVPLLVSVIKRDGFPQTVNAIIAMVVYVVVGVLSVLVSGQAFTLDNLTPAIAIFVTGGTVVYTLFWKNWGDPQVASLVNGGSAPTATFQAPVPVAPTTPAAK
jgi:predicted membrane channel-forming protein YqfA (hemolysin III family)